jgi:DNA-binding GntR family transcriptional regulator
MFTVNILADEQEDLAIGFASGDPDRRFDGVEVERGTSRLPWLRGALTHLDCTLSQEIEHATHTVLIGAVVAAETREGSPLAYTHGQFGRFQPIADDAAYQRVSRFVYAGGFTPGVPLVARELAQTFALSPAGAVRVLKRMVRDGFATRTATGDYVAAATTTASRSSYDASLILHLGVLDSTIGRVNQEQLAEWRRIHNRAAGLYRGSQAPDLDGYLGAALQFHEYFIGLAGNPLLVEIYRRLRTADFVSGWMPAAWDEIDRGLAEHAALLDAYLRDDVHAARDALTRHHHWVSHRDGSPVAKVQPSSQMSRAAHR